MKTVLYILDGETEVRSKRTKIGQLSELPCNVEFAIGSTRDGRFAEWQIFDLLEQIKQNRKARNKTL